MHDRRYETNPIVIDNRRRHPVTAISAASAATAADMADDITLEDAEGMRAVPRLYGDEPGSHGQIKDWKSAVVAGKAFGSGVYEGFTDIFVQTYQRKENEGAVGMAKGFAKGLVSLTMNTGAAAVELLASPGQGVCRSAGAAVNEAARRSVVEARRGEGEWLMMTEAGLTVDRAAVVAAFDEMSQGKGK